MKLGVRIFLSTLIISIVSLFYPFEHFKENLRQRYLEGVEEPLVDIANILAALAEKESDSFSHWQNWQEAFSGLKERKVKAQIYKLLKDRVDLRVYMTDSAGEVLFDSAGRAEVGEDYSSWRDVARTLRGEYGARTTHEVPENSTLYVSAPVYRDGVIDGVLSVGKPTENLGRQVAAARLEMFTFVGISLLFATLLSLFVSVWLTRPVKNLTAWARAAERGERLPFPRLDSSEIGEMGSAFASLQQRLEGKKYVEQYIQHLTHEIKSPLSAIRGAAELLNEPMEEEQRQRFIANIAGESRRIQTIIDRMLELAALENRRELSHMEDVSVPALCNTAAESFISQLEKKGLTLRVDAEEVTVCGDAFLLNQALVNLLQNAVDFSFENEEIELKAKKVEEGGRRFMKITVTDSGTGVAPFAEERVFDKFFSLNRPQNGKKSTGLGLNFVRETALLHGGTVTLKNRPNGGAEAILRLPAA